MEDSGVIHVAISIKLRSQTAQGSSARVNTAILIKSTETEKWPKICQLLLSGIYRSLHWYTIPCSAMPLLICWFSTDT